MSYPPTEAGHLASDNSLFSDSADFDRAEKPITDAEANAGADFNDPDYIQRDADPQSRGVVHLYPEDQHEDYDKPAYDGAAQPAKASVEEQPAPFMKSRANEVAAVGEWVPIEGMHVATNDKHDEFDISTARKPPHAASRVGVDGGRKLPIEFLGGQPDMEGNEEITNCFDEPGLLYRIVNKKNKTWSFYNDSAAFEVHVVCTFGPQSKLSPLGRTVLNDNEKKEHIAEVVVYPGETEMFIHGFVNGFTSKLRALPLSDEYFAERSTAQHQTVIEREMEAVRTVALDAGVGIDDTEAVLQACIDAHVPFVDLSFPPIQSSVEKGSSKRFKLLPWARPRQYLRDKIHSLRVEAKTAGLPHDGVDFDDQVRLFRRPVTPGCVDGGELGDCWLQCAVATLSENSGAVMNLFRHPRGAEFAKAERRVGAYRVTVNKNGLWRSVVVDDYVPVVGSHPKFARACAVGAEHAADTDLELEIWPAILQKAYAKLHGSYANIMSGDPVQALTDLTGAPSYRFDDAFAESSASGGTEIFQRLQEMVHGPAGHNAGSSRRNSSSSSSHSAAAAVNFQVILTTPGKAPALAPGSGAVPQYDFSEEPEMAEMLQGTGLLPGHAYTVLQVKNFHDEGVKLVQVRNPWPYTLTPDGVAASPEAESAIAWSPSSPMWQHHASIAQACGVVGGANRDGDENKRWFAWADVLQYFTGGGVVYHNRLYSNVHDTRVPITFADCRPSLMFELSVAAPTDVLLMLSNMDHRGTSDAGGAVDVDANADYPPVMLSLAMQSDKYAERAAVLSATEGAGNVAGGGTSSAPDDVYRVLLNTSADVAAPSDSKWTFLQAREIAMRAHLTPEEGPYYLIPRLMEGEDTMGPGGANDYSGLAPVHFANRYAHIFPAEASECRSRREIPVTVGVLAPALGEGGAAGIHIKKISGSNSVFENFPKFPTEGDVVDNDAEVYFQTKDHLTGYAVEKTGTDVY